MKNLRFKIGKWWYGVVHISVAYLLYGASKLKLVPFSAFEQWCFCRKKNKYYD